jgi:hypothetical protein
MRTPTAILLLALAGGLNGCGGSGSAPASPTSPTTPTVPTPPATVQLAVFSDPASSFTTSDVRDSGDQIVRFDTTANSLIWAADGRSFAGFPVSGNLLRADRFFQVRFGTKDGERRAYFTEAEATTLCDIEIVGGQLMITPTNVHVPGS